MIHPPTPHHHLAEVNVARLLAPIDDPRIADFANNLDRINALAERMDGFVWRHTDDSGNATETQVDDDPDIIFNCSVWTSAEALERFVWGTVHARFYDRRAEWFRALGSMHFAMWWVPEGHRPDPAEAMARLSMLDTNGPTEQAFGWSELPGTTLWQTHRCQPLAAE